MGKMATGRALFAAMLGTLVAWLLFAIVPVSGLGSLTVWTASYGITFGVSFLALLLVGLVTYLKTVKARIGWNGWLLTIGSTAVIGYLSAVLAYLALFIVHPQGLSAFQKAFAQPQGWLLVLVLIPLQVGALFGFVSGIFVHATLKLTQR